ncbi:MAG: lipopolysaccharide biosynthesis protein [Rikenellaceae bacterium]
MKIKKSLFWSGVDKLSTQGLQFLLTMIIARTVSPSAYGLVAMTTIFVAVSQIFVDSGFSNALIHKQERKPIDFSTIFIFNIFLSIFLYLLIWMAAPWVAQFYEEQELVSVLRVAALSIIINSLSIIQRAILTIAIDFKRQTVISLVAIVVSGALGIAFAYLSFGVWALVWQTLAFQFVSMVGLWFSTQWRPRWEFSTDSFRDLFGYGSKLLLSALIDTIYSNLNSMVIGRRFSAQSLGYYNRAYAFSSLPTSSYSLIVTRVLFPSWCALCSDEVVRCDFKRYISLTSFVVAPIMVLLSMLSAPLIVLTLTAKWLPSANYMSVLCVALIAFPLSAINDNLLKVKGRTDLFLRAEIIKKIIGVALTLTALNYGVMMICYALLCTQFVGLLINIYYAQIAIGMQIGVQIKIIGIRLAISALASVATSALLQHVVLGNICKIVVVGVIYTSIYILLSAIVKIEEIKFLCQFIRSKR